MDRTQAKAHQGKGGGEMSKAIDLTGERFGRLVATHMVYRQKNNMRTWNCVCDCGEIHFVASSNLTNGKTKSCGCYKKTKMTKHGLWETPLYRVWSGMIQRCGNKNPVGYRWYGAKGVRVCEAWINFKDFNAWATNGYRKGLVIDRIDSKKGYAPDNCRWITKEENSRLAAISRWGNKKYLRRDQ